MLYALLVIKKIQQAPEIDYTKWYPPIMYAYTLVTMSDKNIPNEII